MNHLYRCTICQLETEIIPEFWVQITGRKGYSTYLVPGTGIVHELRNLRSHGLHRWHKPESPDVYCKRCFPPVEQTPASEQQEEIVVQPEIAPQQEAQEAQEPEIQIQPGESAMSYAF